MRRWNESGIGSVTDVLNAASARPAAQRKVGVRAMILDVAAGAVAALYLLFITFPMLGNVRWEAGAIILLLIIFYYIVVAVTVCTWFGLSIIRMYSFSIFALILTGAGTVIWMWTGGRGFLEGNGQPMIGWGALLVVPFALVMFFSALSLGDQDSTEDTNISWRIVMHPMGALALIFIGFLMHPWELFARFSIHFYAPLVIFILPTTVLSVWEWIKEHPEYRRFFAIGRGGAARFGGVYTFLKYDFDRCMYGFEKKRAPIYAGKTLWEDDPKLGNRHIGIDDETHMLTVARTGGGKSYYVAWNTLLMWQGGAFILDPKGEHYERTGKGHAVFDPWHVVTKAEEEGDTAFDRERYSVKINPLSLIDPKDPNASTDVRNLVRASLIESKNESANSRHFRKNAEIILRGVIAHILTERPEEFHNLPSVLDTLLTGDPVGGAADPDAFKDLENEMATNEAMGRAPINAAKVLKEAGEPERGGFITTCVSALEWVNEPAIRPMLQGNTFDLLSMKRDKKRLYFVIPFHAMKNHSLFMRTMVQAALLSTRPHTEHGQRCLFLLDEFYQLGKFTPITNDLPALRSQEVTIWMMVQNIGQLKEHYDNWQGFMSACNKQFFAAEDEETAEVISSRLGEYREQWETQDGGRGKARRHDERARPLRRKEEILEEIKEKSGVQYFIPVDGNPMRLRLVPFTENFRPNQYGQVSKSRHG